MEVSDFYINSPDSALHGFARKNHCEQCKKKLANENFFKPVDIVKVTINTNDAIKKIFEVVLKDVHLDLLDVIDLKQMGQFIGSIFIQKVHETVPYLAKTPSPTVSPLIERWSVSVAPPTTTSSSIVPRSPPTTAR